MENSKISIGTILLIIIAIAVVGVVVYLLWPKANFEDALVNINEASAVLEQKDNKNKSLEDYISDLHEMSSLGPTNRKELDRLEAILDAQEESQNYIIGALLYMDKTSSEYKELNDKQNQILENIKKSYNNIVDYIKGPYAQFLLLENPTTAVTKEYADVLVPKYKQLIGHYVEFYVVTAEIIDKASQTSIENNELCQTVNLEIANASNRLLNYDINSLSYSTELLKFENACNKYYDDDLYLKYYNGTLTVENASSEIKNICPVATE